MDTMKQITLNAPGVGDMVTYHATRGVASSSLGHDIAITSGEDGVVYFVDIHTEETLFEEIVCDGTMPALAVVPEQTHLLIVSGDENALYSYKMPPQFEKDELLLRSPVAIRHVACSDKFIAVATEDTEIKVLRRAAHDQIIAIQGHEHGIKSVSFDPHGKLLCSASEDGTVRVFALNEAELSATQVAMFKVQYGDLRSDEVFVRCAWQLGETMELLAVPVNQGIVELFDCATWKSRGQLLLPIGKSKSSDINILAFSPNGQYVAGATLHQELFVWSVATKECVRSFKAGHDVVAVQWAPSQNTLLAFNNAGKLGVISDVIPMGLTPPHQAGLGATAQSIANKPIATTETAAKPATNKTKTTKKKLSGSQFVEDEAMDDGSGGDDDNDDDASEQEAEFEEGETRVEAIKASYGFGSAAASAGEADLGLTNDRLDDEDDYGTTTATRSHPAGSLVRAASASPFQTFQEPFQSGSVQDGAVALLAWTPLGEIECVRGASHDEHLVKVEFADKSRRGFKFSDNYLFSLASLDDHGAFFAVPRRAREDWDVEGATGDHEHGDIISSFVFYRPFDSWASNASWHLALPSGEDAECIATASEFCAVATSLHCLRVYTTGGIAFALLRLPGRVVTLAARGSQLAVVYQHGFAQLAFQLLDIRVAPDTDRVRVLAQGLLPLTPPIVDVFASHKENEQARSDVSQWSTLQWLGFDERGVLYAVDSWNCVQALAKSYGYQWFPLGCVGNALQKKPDERSAVFPLGVVNNALLFFPLERGMAAPKLRGKHRPVPLRFALQHAAFPKTSSSSSSSSAKKKESDGPVVNDLWQQVRLSAICGEDMESHDKRVHEQAEMDKSLILMMKAACTSDEPARVLDLAKCLHLEKSHQIAQKLAVHFGFRALQTQLYDLYRDRFERAEHVDERRAPHAPAQQQQQHRPRPVAQPEPMGARPQPRLGRQPKPVAAPQHDHEERRDGDGQDEELSASEHTVPSSPRAKRELLSASSSSLPDKESHTARSSTIERSVAPVNPFLKKPSSTLASSSVGGETDQRANKKSSMSGGLERLAKFTSPPPAKRMKPSWK